MANNKVNMQAVYATAHAAADTSVAEFDPDNATAWLWAYMGSVTDQLVEALREAGVTVVEVSR